MHEPERASITASADRELVVKAKEDPDMQRAMDLMDLHYNVKMNHVQGEDAGLRQARREVDLVLEKLEGNSPKDKGNRS